MNKAHDNKKLEDHKGKSFILPGKEGKWHGQELEVQSDPLVDAGTGKPYILRCFEFGINPAVLGKKIPSKQEVFNSHWKQIQHYLWKDGFAHCEESAPRVIISDKSYKIFILAKPRYGMNVFEKTKTLQELISK